MSAITTTSRRATQPEKLTEVAERKLADAEQVLIDVAQELPEGMGLESLELAHMLRAFREAYSGR